MPVVPEVTGADDVVDKRAEEIEDEIADEVEDGLVMLVNIVELVWVETRVEDDDVCNHGSKNY